MSEFVRNNIEPTSDVIPVLPRGSNYKAWRQTLTEHHDAAVPWPARSTPESIRYVLAEDRKRGAQNVTSADRMSQPDNRHVVVVQPMAAEPFEVIVVGPADVGVAINVRAIGPFVVKIARN